MNIRLFRLISILTLSFFMAANSYGSRDTLMLQQQNGKPFFWHVVKEGEGSLAIARRYEVYTDDLVKWNHLDLSNGLEIGDSLKIPVTKTNIKKNGKAPTSRAIYHRVAWGENLTTLAQYMNINKEELTARNDSTLKNGLKAGQLILMGWVTDRWDTNGKFIAAKKPATAPEKKISSSVNAKADSILNDQWYREKAAGTPARKSTVIKDSLAYKAPADTAQTHKPIIQNQPDDGFRNLYETQTAENKAISENGLCVFYPVGGHLYFAFHNKAQAGTIIQVKNPGTGKIIYAKVLGTIPANGIYHNAKIVLSSNARKVLGVTDKTFFSNLKYAPFTD